MPKYPDITIKLRDRQDRTAIIIACLRTLRENNLAHELGSFVDDMKNGGTNLITTATKWFNVE